MLDPNRVLLLGGALFLLYSSLQGLWTGLFGLSFLTVAFAAGVALLLAPWWMLRQQGLAFAPTLRLVEPPSLLQAGWALLAGAAAFFPAGLLGEWGVRWRGEPEGMQELMEALSPQDPLGWAAGILGIVVVGPLGEEVLFRGLLQQAARAALGPLAAIVGIGLLFAGVHFLPAYLPAIAFVGIALGVAFERSGSLVAGWLAHAAYNGLVLVALAGGDDGPLAQLAAGGTGPAVAAGGAGLVALALWRLRPWRRW